MLNKQQIFGGKGELLAVKALKRRGYRILAQNYRNRLGEIDIIAMEGDVIVFVEVKARRSHRYGNPKYAVTPAKQRKISLAALVFLKETGRMHDRARFDVVAVDSSRETPSIEIVQNAFPLVTT
ncbi:MAG: YraN family protein [Thermodesulfobacteriota bacterium]